jgi:uncharacterized protein (TIGR02266 family)
MNGEDDVGHENRVYPRVTLPREILCEGEDDRLQSRFADISLGGMFIDTPRQPFPPGALVTVRFLLEPLEPPVSASAEVTYVQEKLGMGVRFVDLQDDVQRRISRYVDDVVAQRLPKPELHSRKSARVSIRIPVLLKTEARGGEAFEENTAIITLSKHGACVLTTRTVDHGVRVYVTTPTGLEFKGTVVWVGNAASRSEGQIGIQSRGLAQALGFDFP